MPASAVPEVSPTTRDYSIVIVGAGPAGLTAAYQLLKSNVTSTILESDSVVGGISRTVERDGWRFDIGGHRFFTKVRAVRELWTEILGDEEFLQRDRMSRLLYQGKLYDYPLKPINALRNLGLFEAARCIASFLWAKIRRRDGSANLEDFYISQFGNRLYQHFFRRYNEKVWGIPTASMSADFGAQRSKGMSLATAVVEALTPGWLKARRSETEQVTSLIETFNYPRFGPGQMWERCAELNRIGGSTICMEMTVTRVLHERGRATSVLAVDREGRLTEFVCTHLLSSMPLSALVRAMEPAVPAEVMMAADGLSYRDFLTVALVVPQQFSFPDNWIYIHDPSVRVGRVQNFGSWSSFLVKEGRTCLGLEYFVNEGDDLWSKSDDALIELAKNEIQKVQLADSSRVEAGYVVRMPKAYPVYDEHYEANVIVLRAWLQANATNVFPVGRNGMHKYNNQDHSMLTAMLSVENMLGANHDVWSVNVEADYHESNHDPSNRQSRTGRDAPILPRQAIDDAAAVRRRSVE